MKVKNIDTFSPYLVIVGIVLYVALAMVAYQYHLRGLDFVSSETLFAAFFGSLLFIIGALTPKIIGKFNLIPKLDTSSISKDKLNDKLHKSKLSVLLNEKIILAVVLVAIFLELLNTYLLGGIPLFSGYLKAKATNDLWRVSYVLFLPAINILIAKYHNRWYYVLFVIGLALFAATGYRTTTMAILISVFITVYYTRGLQFKHFLIFVVVAAVIGIAVGYIAVKSIEWQQWTLNPIQLVFYRAGFTFMVFDKIVHMAGATHGAMFYNTFTPGHPRYIVGDVVLGYHKMITPTIFGPAMLDFGYIALAIQMFLIGLFLRLLHSAHKLADGVFTAIYAVILAHTLIWIETGPTDFIVWLFYALAVIALVVFARSIWGISKKNSKSENI
ncbi:oligosaccharide repeat unit polymerase family protein [Methanobacterium sp.]|uniref:oligosaccharide repeat unit polymerase family protein n=1 Tax=Methanobacterium sp. TaxID=2164 RepID=UPI003C708CD7